MRLLLVMPTGLKVGYDDYFSSSPLGIESLAAHARAHADVSLMDLRGTGHDVEAHADRLLADRPDVVGISVNSAPHTKCALALAKAMRLRRPDLRIIAGGQQATFLVEELLAPGDFDAVIRGEGEHALCEVLQRGGFRGVAGVSWRDGGAIHDEPDRPLIEDLDTVLPPARDLLPDRSRYRMGAYRVEGIEASRGCRFRCSFCSIRNFHRGRWRPKSVGRVMQEVDELLQKYSEPMVIYFADDNFCTDVARVEAICQAIAERKSAAYFWCQARVDTLARNPRLVEWLGKAHFSAILLGLETPVPRLLREAHKGITVEQTREAIAMLHAQDVGVWGTFTLGLPGETREEAEETGRFIPTTDVDIAQITVATPIPGSDLYAEARAAGKLRTTDWDRYDFSSPTLEGQLPAKVLDAIMHRAYLKVYLGLRTLRSLFTQRTNLHRLRRTALAVFWAWISFLIRVKIHALLGRKKPVQAARGSSL